LGVYPVDGFLFVLAIVFVGSTVVFLAEIFRSLRSLAYSAMHINVNLIRIHEAIERGRADD
jgi:hypothetical protein